jgi:hypothetical protein
MALAQDNLDAYAVCYTKAVDRLNRVCGLKIQCCLHLFSPILARR